MRLHYYATHPQTLYGDGRASSDIVGDAREALEEKEHVFQVYFTGCARRHHRGQVQRRMGGNAARCWPNGCWPAWRRRSPRLGSFRPARSVGGPTRVLLPPRTDPGYTLADNLGHLKNEELPPSTRYFWGGVRTAFIQRSHQPIELSSLQIGDVQIVHLPGEPLIDFQLFAQGLKPDGFVAVAGYGDCGPGYICPAQAYLDGGYEPTDANVKPESEGLLKKAIASLLGVADPTNGKHELSNAAYRLTVECIDNDIWIGLDDKQMGLCVAEGPYFYRAQRVDGEPCRGLRSVRLQQAGDRLTIRGVIAGVEIEHVFSLPADRPVMEERILVHNRTGKRAELSDFQAGFVRTIADRSGQVFPELTGDRFAMVPFRAKPDDSVPHYNDWTTADLINTKGYEVHIGYNGTVTRADSDRRPSEGWAWTHGDHTLGIFKFNQENIQWSVLAVDKKDGGVNLRFGGACSVDGEPADLGRMRPDQTVPLGVTLYQTVTGGYDSAAYAFRAFLDENGCRVPKDFDPPVHWNQLYDMGGAWRDRPSKYTKAILEKEAEKAVAYGCQALYLDPGWDTDFGTLIWAEQWMGPRKAFVEEMKSRFGLKVSLHVPLAMWSSRDKQMGGDTVTSTYSPEALRSPPPTDKRPSKLCMGARAYIDETVRRLLDNCADGVTFLVFDGNAYQGGCTDATHGHAVPFTKEDHVRANMEIARRIHEKHPEVIIEVHDPMTAGANTYATPVYYKYGLPYGHDENWGFELMWDPMKDITSGRARALYYYNLACNVPIYLHIDLRKDTPGCLLLWWYASTCRHFGVGGSHPDPAVVAAQKAAMHKYRELDRFFNRGDFYGAGEEIHLHVLPEENAFVANLFNPTAEKRWVEGSIDLSRTGLKIGRLEAGGEDNDVGALDGSVWSVRRELPPWSAEVMPVCVGP